MQIFYFLKKSTLPVCLVMLAMLYSCKKDKTSSGGSTTTTPATATPVSMPLYAAGINLNDTTVRSVYMELSKAGTQGSASYAMLFDTGSPGMILDANNILPASMITTKGFNFTGDSTVVNGITITSQTGKLAYGSGVVYGNLAYANVTLGNTTSGGSITINRLPFMLYYKALYTNGATASAHEFDIMGVSDGLSNITTGVYISSPLAVYTPGTGLTSGFKMAAVPASRYSTDYSLNTVANAITVGLTAADVSSGGYTMHTLTRLSSGDGYFPFVSGTVTYGSKSYTSNYILFDTGTVENYLDDPSASTTTSILPGTTTVKIATNAGFTSSYTSTIGNDYLTFLQNTTSSGYIPTTVIGIQFFYNNAYLANYSSHQLGLKSN